MQNLNPQYAFCWMCNLQLQTIRGRPICLWHRHLLRRAVSVPRRLDDEYSNERWQWRRCQDEIVFRLTCPVNLSSKYSHARAHPIVPTSAPVLLFDCNILSSFFFQIVGSFISRERPPSPGKGKYQSVVKYDLSKMNFFYLSLTLSSRFICVSIVFNTQAYFRPIFH